MRLYDLKPPCRQERAKVCQKVSDAPLSRNNVEHQQLVQCYDFTSADAALSRTLARNEIFVTRWREVGVLHRQTRPSRIKQRFNVKRNLFAKDKGKRTKISFNCDFATSLSCSVADFPCVKALVCKKFW